MSRVSESLKAARVELVRGVERTDQRIDSMEGEATPALEAIIVVILNLAVVVEALAAAPLVYVDSSLGRKSVIEILDQATWLLDSQVRLMRKSVEVERARDSEAKP